MERNEYLKLAQRVHMLPKGVRDFRPNCPDELRVIYSSGEYYPWAVVENFDDKGYLKLSAVIVDCKAAIHVTAPLDKVERKAVNE